MTIPGGLPVVQVQARGPQKSIVCEMSFPALHSEAAVAAELRPLAEQLWQRLQQVRHLYALLRHLRASWAGSRNGVSHAG